MGFGRDVEGGGGVPWWSGDHRGDRGWQQYLIRAHSVPQISKTHAKFSCTRGQLLQPEDIFPEVVGAHDIFLPCQSLTWTGLEARFFITPHQLKIFMSGSVGFD